MLLNLRRTLCAAVFGLFLLSPAVLAQDDGLKIVFPDVDGWEKGDIATYPTAELGFSVPYQSETSGTVTIYVYNGGHSKIADGVEDQLLIKEIRQAEDDIKAYGEAGYYQDVRLIRNDTVVLGGSGGTKKALYALFTFKVRGNEVDSEIYLFGFHNNFIKIRATRLKGKDGPDNPDVNNLLAEVTKAWN